MGIEQFIKSSGKSRVEQFEKEAVGKSKEELRILETQLLKPAKLPPNILEKSAKNDLEARTVTLVFSDTAAFELFSKHFVVLKAGGHNLGKAAMQLLMSLVNELESGRIKYEAETGNITHPTRRLKP